MVHLLQEVAQVGCGVLPGPLGVHLHPRRREDPAHVEAEERIGVPLAPAAAEIGDQVDEGGAHVQATYPAELQIGREGSEPCVVLRVEVLRPVEHAEPEVGLQVPDPDVHRPHRPQECVGESVGVVRHEERVLDPRPPPEVLGGDAAAEAGVGELHVALPGRESPEVCVTEALGHIEGGAVVRIGIGAQRWRGRQQLVRRILLPRHAGHERGRQDPPVELQPARELRRDPLPLPDRPVVLPRRVGRVRIHRQ